MLNCDPFVQALRDVDTPHDQLDDPIFMRKLNDLVKIRFARCKGVHLANEANLNPPDVPDCYDSLGESVFRSMRFQFILDKDESDCEYCESDFSDGSIPILKFSLGHDKTTIHQTLKDEDLFPGEVPKLVSEYADSLVFIEVTTFMVHNVSLRFS